MKKSALIYGSISAALLGVGLLFIFYKNEVEQIASDVMSYLNNSTLPRGLRNNNPGNIRKSTTAYEGEIASADSSFKQFGSIGYGYRAMFVILYTYLSKYGLNTVSKMINR